MVTADTAPASPATPQPAQPAMSQDARALMAYDAAKKSTGVAYLLAIFLGGLGIHRFYLGRTGSGAAMLIITILSVLTTPIVIGLFGLAAIGIWVIVDLFLIPSLAADHNRSVAARLNGGLPA